MDRKPIRNRKEVVIKAIKMREEGMLSKQLNLWIENLLEIEKK